MRWYLRLVRQRLLCYALLMYTLTCLMCLTEMLLFTISSKFRRLPFIKLSNNFTELIIGSFMVARQLSNTKLEIVKMHSCANKIYSYTMILFYCLCILHIMTIALTFHQLKCENRSIIVMNNKNISHSSHLSSDSNAQKYNFVECSKQRSFSILEDIVTIQL